jgi:hypothetical protein
MTVAANLLDAANLAAPNVEAKWVANTLAANVASFVTDVNASFLESRPSDHPIGNWIAVISALQPTIVNIGAVGVLMVGSIWPKELATQYIYRMFKLANLYVAGGFITAGQGTVLLTAYNARFG